MCCKSHVVLYLVENNDLAAIKGDKSVDVSFDTFSIVYCCSKVVKIKMEPCLRIKPLNENDLEYL